MQRLVRATRWALVLLAAQVALFLGPSVASATVVGVVHQGTTLPAGTALHSANGRYRLTVQYNGDLVLVGPTGALWHTGTTGTGARLTVQRGGDVILYVGPRAVWHTGTGEAGMATYLQLTDAGLLAVVGPNGVAWTNRIGNGCVGNAAPHLFLVSLHDQLARFCATSHQILTSPVTTGATALGDATPTGSWQVYAKVRDTVLYPASGGAYPVKYWMPFWGAYGTHDSPWQTFPYGSSLYQTRGSHGCIHLPGNAMAWYFAWAPVGSSVRVTP
jgi:hypothetical protein